MCHGATGAASSSSSASSFASSGSSVPAGPPSWTARRSSRTKPRSVRAASTPSSHPAAFSPNVVGTACWSSVRPIIGVERCASASPAHAAATASRDARIAPSASRETSIAAVSRMSWLVAPWWTYFAASPPTVSRRARTSGSTGFPGDRPSSAIAAGSKFSARQASPIACAASSGMSPARALTAASARSTSSSACSQASSERASRSGAGTKMRSNISASSGDASELLGHEHQARARTRTSQGPSTLARRRVASGGDRGPEARVHCRRGTGLSEEDRLAVALERDVEREPVAGGPSNERRAVLERGENGILGVRLLLVREVHPGEDGLEQAAGEDQQRQVRRLQRVQRRRKRGRASPPPASRRPAASQADRAQPKSGR